MKTKSNSLTLAEWAKEDPIRVLSELNYMLEELGVEMGNMRDLRICIDKIIAKMKVD
jgi:hypothetical protein